MLIQSHLPVSLFTESYVKKLITLCRLVCTKCIYSTLRFKVIFGCPENIFKQIRFRSCTNYQPHCILSFTSAPPTVKPTFSNTIQNSETNRSVSYHKGTYSYLYDGYLTYFFKHCLKEIFLKVNLQSATNR